MDFDVAQTSKVSPTIAACEPLVPELVALWTRHWKETGFLH